MSELLAEATVSLARVQNFDVSSLPRREELGNSFNFEDAVSPASRIVGFFRQIPVEHLQELPDNHLSAIKTRADAFYNTLESIINFQPESDQNPNASRTSILQALNGSYNDLFNNCYPIIAYLASRQRDFGALERQARASMQSVADQAKMHTEQLASDRVEADRILDEVRKVAAEQGVSQQAVYFKSEADLHGVAAGRWQTRTIQSAIAFAVLAAASLFLHKWSYLKPETSYDTIQLATSKVLLLGIMGYLVFLCARNFFANRHNEIVNRHRQNSLLTFKSLADAARADDRRDIVLTHAAACIFGPQETGYTKPSAAAEGSATTRLIEIVPKLSNISS